MFIDGPAHEEQEQKRRDTEQRRRLDDLGYRVLVIRYDQGLAGQIEENPDIFGPGVQTVAAQR